MKSLPLWLYLSNLILTGKFYCLNFFLLKNSDDRIFLSHQHYLLYNQIKTPLIAVSSVLPNFLQSLYKNILLYFLSYYSTLQLKNQWYNNFAHFLFIQALKGGVVLKRQSLYILIFIIVLITILLFISKNISITINFNF